MLKRFILYACRWQLSTPVMAPIVAFCLAYNDSYLVALAVANFVGACIFFWVDKFIFRTKLVNPLWEVQNNFKCFDCGKENCRCYRLVRAKNYDRLDDKEPEFRCESCSEKRTEELRKRGVKID